METCAGCRKPIDKGNAGEMFASITFYADGDDVETKALKPKSKFYMCKECCVNTIEVSAKMTVYAAAINHKRQNKKVV